MKLLVDNQLPIQLATHLRSWGLDCKHVIEVGLPRSDHVEIWNHAIRENQIAVSKDDDFVILASRPSDTGRMIWLRLGNCRNRIIEYF